MRILKSGGDPHELAARRQDFDQLPLLLPSAPSVSFRGTKKLGKLSKFPHHMCYPETLKIKLFVKAVKTWRVVDRDLFWRIMHASRMSLANLSYCAFIWFLVFLFYSFFYYTKIYIQKSWSNYGTAFQKTLFKTRHEKASFKPAQTFVTQPPMGPSPVRLTSERSNHLPDKSKPSLSEKSIPKLAWK